MVEKEYVVGEGWVFSVVPDKLKGYSYILSNHGPGEVSFVNCSIDTNPPVYRGTFSQVTKDRQRYINEIYSGLVDRMPTTKKIGNPVHVFDKVEQRREAIRINP